VLVPILMPIIDFVGKLASVLADTLAQLITTVVVPALNVVTALLKGDFSTAWQNAKQVVRGAIDFMIQIFVNLPSQVGQLMLDLGSALWNGAQAAFGRFKEAAIEKIENDFFPWVANLRFRIIEKIGNLGNTLFSAGREVIQGFIDGVQSRIPSLSSLLSSITNMIPQLKGPPARDRVLLTPAGKLIMDGLIDGINFKIPALENALGNVTGIVGGARMGLQPADQRSMRAQSSASRIAQGAALGMASAAAPNIQIFVGDREITDIVDVRIASANRGYANQVRNGMRR